LAIWQLVAYGLRLYDERGQDGRSRTISCLTGNLPLYIFRTCGFRFWLLARDWAGTFGLGDGHRVRRSQLCLLLEADVAVADDDVIPVSEFVDRYATCTISLFADFKAVEAIAVRCSTRTTVLNRRRSYAIPIR
jgi:hypothetical protein